MEEEKKSGGTVSTSASSTCSDARTVENTTRKFTDYSILRIVGTGTFGKVYLAKLPASAPGATKAKTGAPVAIKVLKKSQIVAMRQVDHIKSEKALLAEVEHPFIVNM